MKIFHGLGGLGRRKSGIWLAAGFFDGVHRGHQAVLRRVAREAGHPGEEAWIMTFDLHPLKLLQPRAAPLLLTSMEHKLRLLGTCGISGCVVLRFTPAAARLRPEEFILRLVRAVPNLRGVVVGRNWTFGRHGAGTPALLKKLGAAHGFSVAVVKPRRRRGASISSTRIRRAVAAGKIDEAAAMLGRNFSLFGTVVSGRGLATRLGFPTANINFQNEVAPPSGVYAVRAEMDGKLYRGVANIGVRPTVSRAALPGSHRKKILEVHLFNVRGNLRGREMEVYFIKKIRAERHFCSLAALKRRIFKDVSIAGKILASQLAKSKA